MAELHEFLSDPRLSDAERAILVLAAGITQLAEAGFATEPGRCMDITLAMMRPEQRAQMREALRKAA